MHTTDNERGMRLSRSGKASPLIAFLLIFALSATVFAGIFISTRATTQNGGVYGVSDSFNYRDSFGGQSAAPAWFGWVQVFVNGQMVWQGHNLITNAGEDVISDCTGRGATGATACTNGGVYIALSTDATAPVATDTTCVGNEQSTNGLARALGTWTHTVGTNSHKIANTFTYTGSSAVTIAKVCMFDASSSGNLFSETVLGSTATVSANGDQITINWTFTH